MWRFWRALPPRGKIGIFFGAWHSAPIVDFAFGRIGAGQLERRVAAIRRFEKMLTDEGTLLQLETAAAVPAVPGPGAGPPTGKTTAHITPTQFRLLVLNSGRTISCPFGEILLIGRSDPTGGIFPEVDLGQDNGYMAVFSPNYLPIAGAADPD